MRSFLFLCTAGCFLIAIPTVVSSAPAEPSLEPQQAPLDIQKLIRNMAWNEMQASQHPAHYYRYIDRDISSGDSQTTDQISTSQGIAKLLIEVNGKPPSASQRQANDQTLSKLANDSGYRNAQLNEQRQNISRRDTLIKHIPQAFIFTYVGTAKDGSIHVKFRPNPHFNPRSHQTLILQGMAGDLWVDPTYQRMVKIDGVLIKDVKLGWGFLADLHKGGRFLMEQSRGSDGTWHQKFLLVHFDGTEFVFKGIHIHDQFIRCCFQRVPDKLTIAEAVHLLRRKTELPEHWEADLQAIEEAGRGNKP